MIIAAWKPRTKTTKGKTIVMHYEKFDINELDYSKSGNIKIIWKCSNLNCKFPDNVYSINFGHWKNTQKGNYHAKNNIENHQCQSCNNSGENNVMYGKTHTDEVKEILREVGKRSKIFIKEKYGVDNVSYLDWIKEKKNQVIINDGTAKELCDNSGLEFISLKGNNKRSKLTVKCKKGHIFKRKWMDLRKGITGCRECFYERLRHQGIKDKKGFNNYHTRVYQYTSITIRKYPGMIENLEKRSREWHLDHKFSICEGFKQNIPPYIIGSYYNLEILNGIENMRKQDRCSITKEELFEKYFEGE